MWQLINRKIGKIQDYGHKLELRLGNDIIKNPIEIAEKLHMYFTNTVTELVQKNINTRSNNNACQIIKRCLKSIFISPVTKEEVVSLAKNLKNKPTAGPDDIPESLVKQCILHGAESFLRS